MLDSCCHDNQAFRPFLRAAAAVVREQFVHLSGFTIFRFATATGVCVVGMDGCEVTLHRCCEGVERWREGVEECGEEAVSEAVEWVEATPVQNPVLQTSVSEAVRQALTLSEVCVCV